jgi:peptide/nickel transport system permease protein
MLGYLVRRLLIMIPTLAAISAISFAIIQLPPGDYLTTIVNEELSRGEQADMAQIRYLRETYGLDEPLIQQYFAWIGGVLQGDFGYSFEHRLPVTEVVGDKVALTVVVTLATTVFIWVVAFPIGVYSATHQYSWGDYGLTFLGFIGLATPNFPLALEHLWVPVIVIGTSGTAAMIRRLRANLLDELQKQYFQTALAKGLKRRRALLKYPLRMSLNPFIADIGSLLPELLSGATIVAVVLNLPTTGPLLLRALQSQDMYLAGSFVLLLAVMTVIGVLISDLLLAVLDPRIRMGGAAVK